MARAVLVLVLWLLLLHFIAFIFPSCVSYNYGPARNQLKLLLHFCCNFFHSLVAVVLKSDFSLLFPLFPSLSEQLLAVALAKHISTRCSAAGILQ